MFSPVSVPTKHLYFGLSVTVNGCLNNQNHCDIPLSKSFIESIARQMVAPWSWIALEWVCVPHWMYRSLLMRCHKASVSLTHERPKELSGINDSGAEHRNAWLREIFCDWGRNYPDSLWLGPFRLSASLCVIHGTQTGRGPLAAPCPKLRACRFPFPLACARPVLCRLRPPQREMIPLQRRWALGMISHYMRCWAGAPSL